MDAPRSSEEFLGSAASWRIGSSAAVTRRVARRSAAPPVRLISAKRGGQHRLQRRVRAHALLEARRATRARDMTDSPIAVAQHEAMVGAKWRVELVPLTTSAGRCARR